MSALPADPAYLESLAVAAAWLVVKTTLVLALAALVQVPLRRRASAATRHLVWMTAIVVALALPLASLTLPAWRVALPVASIGATANPTPPAVVEAASGIAPERRASESIAVEAPALPAGVSLDPVSPPASSAAAWPLVALAVYAAGVVVMLACLGWQQWRARRCLAGAASAGAEWAGLFAECRARSGDVTAVALMRSQALNVPVVIGVWRPAIVVPATAEAWSDDRRRAVLLHELAHVARRDTLTQFIAAALQAMYWFNPLAWWAVARLRVERELACDDRVIAAGTEAREYAGHLLEIAYSLTGHRAPALAVSMARPRQLEGRLLAALDTARNRRQPPRRVRLGLTAAAVALLVPLASAMPGLTAPDSLEETGPAPLVASAAQSQASPEPKVIGPHLEAIDWSIVAPVRQATRFVSALVEMAQSPQAAGTWDVRPSEKAGQVRLRLVEANSSSETGVPLGQFTGLTAAHLSGDGGPVTFTLRRDAGTFSFEGVIRRGVGAGTFTFAPEGTFPDELVRRGFARPTAAEQYQLARHDVGYAFLDELTAQGYAKTTTAELVRAGHHGVHQTYVREMGALGYRLGTLPALITLRDHGVTPTYVRELADLGYKGLSADGIRRARDHGITPDYVRGMRDAGYGSLPLEALVNARDHGVTPEYVARLRAAGHDKLALDHVIRVRDHGVTPEYVHEMKQLGHALPIDALVRARDHGVDPPYVRELSEAGLPGLSMDTLIKLRNHGVTPGYVRDLKGMGYDSLSSDDLIWLRSHGLTAERIRTANAKAGSKLPLDLLRSMAMGGL